MELSPRRFADTVVLAPAGRIDHTASEEFRSVLWPHLDGCAGDGDRVVLDLSGVPYISSAGLRVLLLARKHVKARGGRLVVAALEPVVREIFEISRFTLVVDCYPTVPDALAAISPAALLAWGQG